MFCSKCGKSASEQHSAVTNSVCLLPIVAAMAICLCGCDPDETVVTVSTSALRTAAEGGLGKAKVVVSYDLSECKDLDLPLKIKKAALPFLGEGASIEIERTIKKKVRTAADDEENEEEEVSTSLDDAKLVASFTIPVGADEALKRGKSILWLRYSPNDKVFSLINGNSLSDMNTTLYKINDDVECEFKGSTTVIKVNYDEPHPIGVAAVAVGKEKVLVGTFEKKGGKLSIDYCNDFYNEIAPCFTWGSIHDFKAVKMTEVNSGEKASSSSWDW